MMIDWQASRYLGRGIVFDGVKKYVAVFLTFIDAYTSSGPGLGYTPSADAKGYISSGPGLGYTLKKKQ